MNDRGKMKVIGGSTISAIIGLSPYNSAFGVWAQLTGQSNIDVQNESVDRGNKMEPWIAEYYAMRHPEYQVMEHVPVFHERFQYIMGSPDRILIGTESGNLEAGLEIKTVNIVKIDEWGDEGTNDIPIHYWVQCQWYAGLLGVSDWNLAVAFVRPGTLEMVEHREYSIQFDKVRYEKLIRAAVVFWETHVETGVPPKITKSDLHTVNYLRNKYPSHKVGVWAERTKEIDEIVAEYLEAKQQDDSTKDRLETARMRLVEALGDAEGYESEFGRITYRQSKPTMKVDWESIAKSFNPTESVIKSYTKEIAGSRRLNIPRERN